MTLQLILRRISYLRREVDSLTLNLKLRKATRSGPRLGRNCLIKTVSHLHEWCPISLSHQLVEQSRC